MQPLLNIALQAARSASQLILRGLDRLDTVTITEKSKNDFVTEIDTQAEQQIIYTIRKAYPNHAIRAEESGEQQGSDEGSDTVWIIDPLDGTTNFIHGIPHFAISIAVMIKGRVEHGLIYDPVRDETFSATRGSGARLNHHRIRVTKQPKIDSALLGTGLPFRSHHLLETYLKTLIDLSRQASDIRRAGSAALDLAYVAAGRLDGYWEFDLAAWDLAAGALIVKEAGGYVTDFDGRDDYLDNGNIIAANPKIYPYLFNAVKRAL